MRKRIMDELDLFIAENKFEKRLKNLKKRLKNKKVIIYGTGTLFQKIIAKYDFSFVNIIGVSDLKYNEKHRNTRDFGCNVVLKEEIAQYNPDYVIVAMQNYASIIEDFVCDTFKGKKIKVIPLVSVSIFRLLKKIWME